MKFDLKRFFIINIGLIILASSLHFFMIPSSLAVGGATGLAMVINNLIPSINYGLILAIINVVLYIIAFIFLGKEFGGYTLYSSMVLSLIISMLEFITPMTEAFTDDLFINLIFGILIGGMGMGIIFNQNASTGGTDIIAKIINKYTHIDIGKSLLIADFLITLFASFVFGARLGMYALLGVIINSYVIDKMIAGFNVQVNMIIISSKVDEINRFILDELSRGTTIYHASGGFSNQDKRVLNTVVSRRQYIRIRDFVRAIDDRAFVTISYITEVEGEGFTYDL